MKCLCICNTDSEKGPRCEVVDDEDEIIFNLEVGKEKGEGRNSVRQGSKHTK